MENNVYVSAPRTGSVMGFVNGEIDNYEIFGYIRNAWNGIPKSENWRVYKNGTRIHGNEAKNIKHKATKILFAKGWRV